MKYFLVVVLLAFAQLSFGQIVDSVSKIVFRYAKGHNSWGERGVYDNGELIEISRLRGNTFVISKYLKISRYDKGDGTRSIADTVNINVKGYPTISQVKIEKLLTALNTSKDNFNAEFVISCLSHPRKAEILEVARSLDQYKTFTDSDSEKEERNKWFRDMRGFKRLGSFMNQNKPDPNDIAVTVDAWHFMRIYCISEHDTIKFDSQFFKLAGQPIQKFKRHSYDTDKGIVNLEVNTIITDLLPKQSLLRKSVSLESLKEEYLEWYIKNELHY
ncbi:MAG: hypothetical protein JST32_01470 [Bacteroidetes bacterium]|nr:hypothetical protein [Bacteroidota bacterium]